MSTPMNDPSASQSATNMVEDTAAQVSGKTIPALTYQPIPSKHLGIKIRVQPENEDDIDIESVTIYNPLV